MNLQGKTVLITGSSDGLGKAVALLAAKAGATVLIHGRGREKAEAVLEEVRRAGSKDAEIFLADMASLDEVRQLAAAVAARHSRLDVLINNAGIFRTGERAENAAGVELHFQVNYLAPFLLTRLLLPQIKAAAPSRIVNVASIGQAPIDFDDVQFTRGYGGMDAYRRSKLAQIMFTFDLAGQLEGSGVTVMSLHPATLMNTGMVVSLGMPPQSKVEDGARATFELAFAPEHASETGGYYDQFTPAQPNAQAADAGARKRLWEISEKLTGLAA
jgi:NAD(P)-dependent dehydrogenase (short-subunit alcohol dehydrogenase family)